MKDVNQDGGKEITSLFNSFNSTRGTGGGVKIPELHSIHQGTIKRIQAFGAFVAVCLTPVALRLAFIFVPLICFSSSLLYVSLCGFLRMAVASLL